MSKIPRKKSGSAPGAIRIIAGKWRSRRIPVLALPGVRPTGDRVRETLFNWLGPYLPGARCLDLFAGSGVLSFEALSRGAERASLVESDTRVVEHLKATAEMLGQPEIVINAMDACKWLASTPPQNFDVVFLDPPFNSELLDKSLDLIVPDWLADKALIYIETSGNIEEVALPTSLEWTKRTQIGNVGIGLASRRAETLP